MALIQQKKMGKGMDNMRLKQIYRIICLSVSFALVAVYAILTFQRYTALSRRMSDGADLLALRIQDRLSSMQALSIYLSSLNDVDTLLVQESPSFTGLSKYDRVLCYIIRGELSVELMLHKSQMILISDYGLTNYDDFFDQNLLQGLRAEGGWLDRWALRDYQQNIYVTPRPALSYIRSLPLSSVQDSGYIIVSQSLNSLAKTASIYAESGLGDYAVWLDDMLLTSSSDPAQASEAESRHSNVEISARAIYWMPLSTMLLRSLPQLWSSLGIWLVVMILCKVIARMLYHKRMAKLDMLVREMRSEWDLDEDQGDQDLQLYSIFESLTAELFHARQMTRESMPLLRERLIGELLRTRLPIEQRRESLARCNISLKAPYFAVVQVTPKQDAFDEQTYLLVRRNVQSQLSALGEVYSTYGDDSSILFLINATECTDLSEHLKALCETMHDALNSFLRVDIVFSIGICSQTDPHPHDAYIAAREQLSTLLLMEKQPQDAVVLTSANATDHLHKEAVQKLCDAVAVQDAAAMKDAYDEVTRSYLLPGTAIREIKKRAMALLMQTCALLTEMDLLSTSDPLVDVVSQLQSCKSAGEVQETLEKWYRSLIGQDAEADVEGNQYVEAAIRLIEADYRRIQNVQEIGKKINVNPIYLNRLFKFATGKTVSGYLSQYRCDQARKMLQDQQYTIREISDACGFSEMRSFIRYFKIYYEETPTEYRKRIQG